MKHRRYYPRYEEESGGWDIVDRESFTPDGFYNLVGYICSRTHARLTCKALNDAYEKGRT